MRVLAFLEAATITGPAKNLLQFAQIARHFTPPVDMALAVFCREGDSGVLLQACKLAGVPLHPIHERGRFDASVIPQMTQLAREWRPDIIQSHAVKSHFLVRRSGLHRLYPWVAFHHGYTWTDLKVRLYNHVDRWSLRAASRVVTVSLPFRDELVSKGVPAERIAVVHNAVDPEWAANAHTGAARLRETLHLNPGKQVILSVGRLSREKDHLTLLEAVAAVHDAGVCTPHLLIVGEGPERRRIEETARRLNLHEHVTLTGHVASAEDYYGIADIVAISSRSEGSPNALLESMAAGVPVVSTAVGGIPEIVTDKESALLIQAADRESMARAITDLLTDRVLAEKLVVRARELAESRHSPSGRAQHLYEIYRGVLQ